MAPRVSAIRDASLSAVVLRRLPLLYRDGADPGQDRPAHIRAASSLAWLGERLAVVQDDANFLALIDPANGWGEAWPLPAGEGGARQFDVTRGTKHLKLDFEACVTAPAPPGEILVAFGSGSTPNRETLALIHATPTPHAALHHAPALYRQLRECETFAGSELNLEGAVYADGRLRLFNRGNGAPRQGRSPVNATGDLVWDDLLAWLLRSPTRPPPPLQNVVQYDLGALEGQPFGFTDGAIGPWGWLYSAAAENSPDAVEDGDVAGSAVGVFEKSGGARWIELRLSDGAIFPSKVEGLCPSPTHADRVYVVVDVDDPRMPSELCEVALAGNWNGPQDPSA